MHFAKSIAVSAFLFSMFAGIAVAAPTEAKVHLARHDTDVTAPDDKVNSTRDNSAVENVTNLAANDVDAANTTDTGAGGATDSTGAVGGLLSGLTGTVGNVVGGLTGAVGNVVDGVTGSNAVGGLLSGVTDTVGGVVGGVGGAAGSVVDGATGLKRNAKRTMFRRRLDTRHFDDLA